MKRVDPHFLRIALLLFIAISVLGGVAAAGELKSGAPNTVTLPDGQVVYNLNGEWAGTFEAPMERSDDIVKITQTGNQFVGIRPPGSPTLEGIKGVLEKDQFREIYVYMTRPSLGAWVPFQGRISENGNKIDLFGTMPGGVVGPVNIGLSRK